MRGEAEQGETEPMWTMPGEGPTSSGPTVAQGPRVRAAGRVAFAGVLAASLVLGASACGSSTTAAKPAVATARSGTRAKKVSGTANVAFAGSLELLDDHVIGPAFSAATGYAYEGRGGGSYGVAHEIEAGELTPGVFESIGAGPIDLLEPKFTRWYVQVAASPIVVAYDPKTPFAPELRAIAEGKRPLSDLFALMEAPGFHLGRTNPDTDPQGQAFYEMVELAAARYHLRSGTVAKVLGGLENPSEVFAETALESRLEAGQLDAASAFLSQAVQLHLPYVALPAAIDFGDPGLATSYARATLRLTDGQVVHGVPLVVDATVLGSPRIGVQSRAAATAFVAYLLSAAGRKDFSAGGYHLLTPTLVGDTGSVPAAIRHAVGRS